MVEHLANKQGHKALSWIPSTSLYSDTMKAVCKRRGQKADPEPLTKQVYTHSLGSCSLQLEKVVVESAQVFSTSL